VAGVYKKRKKEMIVTEFVPSALLLTDSARKKAIELKDGDKLLRVYVHGGGCSGFQYRFELVDNADADDLHIETEGQTALVDPVSVPFLKGSEIAFIDELAAAQFVVRNPNAASSCGCGVSFSI